MENARQLTFEHLATLALVKQYEKAFRLATGWALRLVPAGTPASWLTLGTHGNEFCSLVVGNPAVAEVCWKCETAALRRVAKTSVPDTVVCFAGMQVVAVPVLVGGVHVATWIGGQVLARRPTRGSFNSLVKQLTRLGVNGDLPRIKAALFRSRVVPAEQFQALGQLLAFLAQHLGETAERLAVQTRVGEPQLVIGAKEYIRTHLTEVIRLPQVATKVGFSPHHFCRVFKQATGFKFTEYVARLRIERAKTLLANPQVRVGEVVFAAGFGSIAQFNAAFSRYAGMTPSQYRATAKSQKKIAIRQ